MPKKGQSGALRRGLEWLVATVADITIVAKNSKLGFWSLSFVGRHSELGGFGERGRNGTSLTVQGRVQGSNRILSEGPGVIDLSVKGQRQGVLKQNGILKGRAESDPALACRITFTLENHFQILPDHLNPNSPWVSGLLVLAPKL